MILKTQATKTYISVDGPFRANALAYLEAVKAMPSYADRVRDMFHWIVLFDQQARDTVTPVQIRAQRDQWLTVGPRMRQKGKKKIIENKDLEAGIVYPPGRKKGQGTRGSVLPLLPDAVEAFKALDATAKLTERYALAAVQPALLDAYAKMANVHRAVATGVTTKQKRP